MTTIETDPALATPRGHAGLCADCLLIVLRFNAAAGDMLVHFRTTGERRPVRDVADFRKLVHDPDVLHFLGYDGTVWDGQGDTLINGVELCARHAMMERAGILHERARTGRGRPW